MSICNLDHFGESYWEPRRHVLVGGCFDPLHEGHLAYFEQASAWGPLVCAVMPDRAVTKRTLCLPEMTRLKVLNACALLEHVHLATYGIAAVIRALKPKAYVVGREYLDRTPPEEDMQACGEVGTQLVYVDCRERSSTALLADYTRRENAAKLAQFETWVREQKPAEAPWQPVTHASYLWRTRRKLEKPHAKLIVETFQPESIVDVGCGPKAHLVRALRDIGASVIGFDEQGDHADRVTHCGTSILGEFINGHCYDLVICREVLEHLTARELAVAVRNLVKLSSRCVYVTTRFTPKPHLLDFDASDDLDPTHITMLNQDLLRTLFTLEGCTHRADLEQRMDWQKKGRVLVYEVPK